MDVRDVASATLTGNVIDSVGSDGIYVGPLVVGILRGNTVTHAGGNGISGATNALTVTVNGNRILDAALDGIGLELAMTPFHTDSNVVGRARGRGIVVKGLEPPYPEGTVRTNTVYESGGSGIVVVTRVDSLDHNISYGNGGYGLTWGGSAPAYFGCNDWFGNVSGATSGVAPGTSDLAVNPLFCDLPNEDVHLSAASPLADVSGCGLIGALGVGCAAAVSVDGRGAVSGPMFAAIPSPSSGHVTFAIRGVSSAAMVEVFDLTGARRWRGSWQPGESALEWEGTNAAGQAVAPGVYYARLTSGALIRSARVVLFR
jgi:hypothetical protein